MTTTAVDVAGLERELQTLWISDEGSKKVQTRACTLNLIACAPDAHTAELMAAAVQRLTVSYPNRTVMVVADGSTAEARIEAWVQANCVLAAPGVPQVCGEQITIAARGGAVGQVGSLVLSLLLPDVPVVLWAPGAGVLHDPLVARLRAVADRLIVDSGGFVAPASELVALAELSERLRTQNHHASLSDLSWTRLTAWRELTAQFFDTRPLLGHLHRLDQVDIAYGAPAIPGGPPFQGALLLASWLASSLGWAFVRPEQQQAAMLLHFDRPAVNSPPGERRTVVIVLRPVAGIHQGDIASIHLRCLDNIRAEFSVERTDAGSARTTARADGEPTIGRLARMETPDTAELLGSELRLLSRDRTFGAALGLAGRIASMM